MTEILSVRLFKYLEENNPDLVLAVQAEDSIKNYLDQKLKSVEPLLLTLMSERKPQYIIEEICMEHLTQSLSPSKFNYIKGIAEEKFPKHYQAFERCGILKTELVNLVNLCFPLFEAFNFSEESEGDERLRYVITLAMKGYFKESERETVKKWLTTYIIS